MTRDGKLEIGLIGGVEKRVIEIVPYQEAWAAKYLEHAERILEALGDRVLSLEHVGSTSVSGLAAKPIVDIDLMVADSADEAAYLPALEAVGYELRVREPDWYEHRMMRTPAPALDVHVHVFSPGAEEVRRHVMFRDWLRTHDADRDAYATLKKELAKRDWADMNAYAQAKSEFIEEVLVRAGWTAE